MKFNALLPVLATALSSFVLVQAQESKDWMAMAIWCCFDSNETCSDACEYINVVENQIAYGLGIGYFSDVGPGDLPSDWAGIELTLSATGFSPTFDDLFGVTVNEYSDVPPACRAMSGMVAAMQGVDHPGFKCCDAGDGYVCGDPHFMTWGDETYDYQGECDLKFLSAPHFGRDVGMDIHVRTKIKFDYSYIESAAIKIGDATLEIAGWGEYLLDGVMSAVKGSGESKFSMMDGVEVTHTTKGQQTHVFHIDAIKIGGGSLKIQTFKSWVSIHMEHPMKADYADSTGMLGSFPKGERFGRDGVTILSDDNEFGQEWQVLPEEATLFAGAREPQHPKQCIMPALKSAGAESRRLAGSFITEEMARDACADVPSHQEFCVYDVLASQDLEMAQAGAF